MKMPAPIIRKPNNKGNIYMKNNFSFLEKYPFKYVLSFCLFAVFMDFYRFVRIFFLKQSIHITIPWFYFGMGLFLILMATINIKYKMEKIAVIAFGIAFILNSFLKIPEYQAIFSVLILLLDIGGAYCFWLANKVCIVRSNDKENVNKNKIIILLLLLILIPAIFLWLIGIATKKPPTKLSLILPPSTITGGASIK